MISFKTNTHLFIGVNKGLIKSPIGGTQGIAAIEPAAHFRELMKSISDEFRAAGIEVELEQLDKNKY